MLMRWRVVCWCVRGWCVAEVLLVADMIASEKIENLLIASELIWGFGCKASEIRSKTPEIWMQIWLYPPTSKNSIPIRSELRCGSGATSGGGVVVLLLVESFLMGESAKKLVHQPHTGPSDGWWRKPQVRTSAKASEKKFGLFLSQVLPADNET